MKINGWVIPGVVVFAILGGMWWGGSIDMQVRANAEVLAERQQFGERLARIEQRLNGIEDALMRLEASFDGP